MPPGWMPVPCSVAPPSWQASSMRARARSSGYHQPTGVTTSLPERRMRATVGGSAMSGA